MATTLSRDRADADQIFPVEVLRSLLPMILAGLYSTQIRIRQSTYRFIICGHVLSGMRWLAEKDGVELLKAMEHAQEEFEAETCDKYGRKVAQISDFGTIVLNHVVESGGIHPTTLKPMVPAGDGDIKWVWFDSDNKEFPLGAEEVFTDDERARVNAFLEARVIHMSAIALTEEQAKREAERLKRKEKERSKRKERRVQKEIKKRDTRDKRPCSTYQTIQKTDDIQLARRPTSEIVREVHVKHSDSGVDRTDSLQNTPCRDINSSVSTPNFTSTPIPLESVKVQPENFPHRPSRTLSSRVASENPGSMPSLRATPGNYDKRMPPPSVDWRIKGGSHSRSTALSCGSVDGDSWSEGNIARADPKDNPDPQKNSDHIVHVLVQETQNADAPSAKASFITGKRNQLDFRNVDSTVVTNGSDDTDETKMINRCLREGDDRIGISSDDWKEITSRPASSDASGRKRRNVDDESPEFNKMKRRKLKSEYCPAVHTTWKPAWLGTTQCYPVDQAGEDMSDVECLRGDGIHRNADKLKRILETESMYIPTHRIDELMAIAEETCDCLKRTKQFYAYEHPRDVRIEKHECV